MRMIKQKVHIELKPKYKALGYTTRADVNVDLIRALKRLNKESAIIINWAIKSGDVKTAIKEMQDAKNRNREISEMSSRHDKIVFDSDGNSILLYERNESVVYLLESMEDEA